MSATNGALIAIITIDNINLDKFYYNANNMLFAKNA
jgi:hypothetical protein